jgi:hypothetical protein
MRLMWSNDSERRSGNHGFELLGRREDRATTAFTPNALPSIFRARDRSRVRRGGMERVPWPGTKAVENAIRYVTGLRTAGQLRRRSTSTQRGRIGIRVFDASDVAPPAMGVMTLASPPHPGGLSLPRPLQSYGSQCNASLGKCASRSRRRTTSSTIALTPHTYALTPGSARANPPAWRWT